MTIDELSADVRARLANVRMLLLDVDGVLTDGHLHIDDHGVESKAFYTRDGFALVWLKQYGLVTGAISGRKSPATEMRCRDLHFDEIHMGDVHKLPVLNDIITRTGIPAEAIAYIGDDVLDLPIMRKVGVSAAPSDSHTEVLRRVDIILDRPGGSGAVRCFLDLWLMATGRWESALEDIFRGNF
ncbi:MAG TPA: HAD hydrolase family protein [bacterium]|jgi:3-deoxy-D-manno-octulosonate 8-phosphate phosphatase (KDO 8-P phosphatase)